MAPGNIILLNGTSSSGKTSIVKALQEVMEMPYLDAGIDKFLWMLPSRYLNTALWHEVYEYVWPEDGRSEGLVIKACPLGHRLMSGMHRAIAVLSQAGNNVVADHVLAEPAWVQECAEVLAELPALFVGICCPLDVLEQREKERRDRTLGQARAQFDLVHAHGIYDFEVDTSRSSAIECALQIKERLRAGPRPTAFKRLRG